MDSKNLDKEISELEKFNKRMQKDLKVDRVISYILFGITVTLISAIIAEVNINIAETLRRQEKQRVEEIVRETLWEEM